MLFAVAPGLANAAEPLTMFLLDLLRQQVVSSVQSSIDEAQRQRQKAAASRPPFDLEDQKLRALIDEGFVHLSSAQRNEIFTELKRGLADPKNAHLQPMIMQEVALKASAVRQAHERLAALSLDQKHAVAVQAREEYRKLAPAERAQMLDVVRAGIVPIPRDLNDIILAEFSSVTAAAAAAAGKPEAAERQAN
ncbi:MAG: hypothetical protein OEZ08_07160 [Betaproteobacteria bacterium]|nr:hypothetical protein [Betaproteobacteria bacterium]